MGHFVYLSRALRALVRLVSAVVTASTASSVISSFGALHAQPCFMRMTRHVRKNYARNPGMTDASKANALMLSMRCACIDALSLITCGTWCWQHDVLICAVEERTSP